VVYLLKYWNERSPSWVWLVGTIKSITWTTSIEQPIKLKNSCYEQNKFENPDENELYTVLSKVEANLEWDDKELTARVTMFLVRRFCVRRFLLLIQFVSASGFRMRICVWKMENVFRRLIRPGIYLGGLG
jgi:hypothetical protein